MTGGSGESDIRAAAARAEPPKADGRELDLTLAGYPTDDLGNAKRLIERFGRDVIYVHGRGWLCWDGKRWKRDRSGLAIEKLAHKTARGIFGEAEAAFRHDPENVKHHKKLRDWAGSSANSQRINAMVAVAKPYLEVDIDRLDADPHLLTVRNGTLDLSGGLAVLRPHRRKDYVTMLADVDYDPDAPRARFTAFLDRVLPDPAVQAFVQRYYGYSLTGLGGEQVMLMNCGRGANGKSTLNNALRAALGDYATSTPFETFLADERRTGSQPRPDLIDLMGRRLVLASEPENNARLSAAMIKRVTGGEPIKARDLNEGFVEFRPTYKAALSFNEKPAIPAQDDGTWRRPLLVEFGVRIPEGERDTHLDAKLAAEASGVLNWLIDGFYEWREKGVAPPASVVAATLEYRAENDPLGHFLAQRTRRTEGRTVSGKEFFEAYRKWCEGAGHKPMSMTKFGTVMPQRGYDKSSTTGFVLYRDVELVSEESSSAFTGGYDAD